MNRTEWMMGVSLPPQVKRKRKRKRKHGDTTSVDRARPEHRYVTCMAYVGKDNEIDPKGEFSNAMVTLKNGRRITIPVFVSDDIREVTYGSIAMQEFIEEEDL